MYVRMPLPSYMSYLIKIQNDYTFSVPAYLGCSGQEAIKQV